MNTRSYRLNRLAIELELYESTARRATNEVLVASIDRSAPGVAPLEPGMLMALFAGDAAAAWSALASLSRAQLINQAIETASWLEQAGVVVAWGSVLQRWETRLVEITVRGAA